MTGAPLTIVVMAALMAVMTGGFGAAWVVHRLTSPSVGRAAWISMTMAGPVGVVGLAFPQWFTLSGLWVLGVLVGVLWELGQLDRHRRCCHYDYRWPGDSSAVHCEVLTAEERQRFHDEIDAYRGVR